MRKTVSFLCFLMFVNIVVFGQQDPQYTNNMFYKMGVNPGYAGAEDAINGLLLNRYQWVGYGGGEPKTMVLSVDAAINAFGAPGGIGINIVSDQYGYYDNMWINFDYSYKVETSFGTLGLGVSPGIYNFNINPDDGWTSSDDVLNSTEGGTGDNLIPQQESSQLTFDIGLGAYLYTNKYYLGVSASHLNQGEVKYDDLAVDFLVRHYYLMGGYNIKLTDPLFELRPSFLFKSDLASWQVDLNTNVVYNDKFWAGLSYRVQDAVALLMGVELFNGLRIGYSFDLVTSALKRNSFSSHEFFVSYSIDLERSRNQKYKSIRFL
ncbi:PorP/SprF family type IX secretion system membrane protein [Maribellus mangrovi]|uniref:PorP/SprF family type IX secretion system membrane protein n=1 Tax=Maribellus mangrovi TaxID=3133146 RepID=UPI0030ECC902